MLYEVITPACPRPGRPAPDVRDPRRAGGRVGLPGARIQPAFAGLDARLRRRRDDRSEFLVLTGPRHRITGPRWPARHAELLRRTPSPSGAHSADPAIQGDGYINVCWRNNFV